LYYVYNAKDANNHSVQMYNEIYAQTNGLGCLASPNYQADLEREGSAGQIDVRDIQTVTPNMPDGGLPTIQKKLEERGIIQQGRRGPAMGG
jgi:hypothetical protein